MDSISLAKLNFFELKKLTLFIFVNKFCKFI